MSSKPDLDLRPPNRPTATFIPAEAYTSRRFHDLEKSRLWPRVWQMACREEELPNVGNFLTYDVAEESIIVSRTGPDTFRAYHNVCPHRGRRLTTGCGHAGKFLCRFHGWKWNLDGTVATVVDRDDWGGALDDEDLKLKEVRLGRWGGWIFVNMDPEAEPLEEFLSPAAGYVDCFRLQDMRYLWRRQAIIPCNWKVALEAFDEGYHVQTTHRQLIKYFDDMTQSRIYGKHGMFGYYDVRPFGSGSPRLGEAKEDIRQPLADYFAEMKIALNSTLTDTIVASAQRLPKEVPAGTPPYEVLGKLMEFARETDAARGVEWPEVSAQQMVDAGTDWHIFPNMVILPAPTSLLGYRARPNGDDPDSCIFDIYALEKFPAGEEPKVEVITSDDLTDMSVWGEIVVQDFDNMADVQRGMKSMAFAGAIPNPRQEGAVLNFHRVLSEYLHSDSEAEIGGIAEPQPNRLCAVTIWRRA